MRGHRRELEPEAGGVVRPHLGATDHKAGVGSENDQGDGGEYQDCAGAAHLAAIRKAHGALAAAIMARHAPVRWRPTRRISELFGADVIRCSASMASLVVEKRYA